MRLSRMWIFSRMQYRDSVRVCRRDYTLQLKRVVKTIGWIVRALFVRKSYRFYSEIWMGYTYMSLLILLRYISSCCLRLRSYSYCLLISSCCCCSINSPALLLLSSSIKSLTLLSLSLFCFTSSSVNSALILAYRKFLISSSFSGSCLSTIISGFLPISYSPLDWSFSVGCLA